MDKLQHYMDLLKGKIANMEDIVTQVIIPNMAHQGKNHQSHHEDTVIAELPILEEESKSQQPKLINTAQTSVCADEDTLKARLRSVLCAIFFADGEKKPFSIEDYAEINEAFTSGAVHANLKALGCYLTTAVTIMKEIKGDLWTLLKSIALKTPFKLIRKFVVHYFQLENAGSMIYAALLAPSDHPYYQENLPGSEHEQIKARTELVPIRDYPQYKK